MKQPCEKSKMGTETIDIDMPFGKSPTPIATEGGNGKKEPYEKPKMVIETIGDNGHK